MKVGDHVIIISGINCYDRYAKMSIIMGLKKWDSYKTPTYGEIGKIIVIDKHESNHATTLYGVSTPSGEYIMSENGIKLYNYVPKSLFEF